MSAPAGSTPEVGQEEALAQRAEAGKTAPHIYVASLTDYVNGELHGAWIPASICVESMQGAVDEMLAQSPPARRRGSPAEEWAIHDFDGFGSFIQIHELASLEEIHDLATGLVQHGDAFGAWADFVNDEAEKLDDFESHYIGEYKTLEAFGEQQLDDMGLDLSEMPGVPETLRPYVTIQVGRWVRDLELSGVILSREGEGEVVCLLGPLAIGHGCCGMHNCTGLTQMIVGQ